MQQRTETRMTEPQACAIAAEAAKGTPFAKLMTLVTVEQEADRVRWVVAAATIGAGYEVIIDDATGKVERASAIGGR